MADIQETNTPTDEWTKDTLEKIALSGLKEQRTTRRWATFFKILTFIYLFVVLFAFMGWIGKNKTASSGDHTAVIDVKGVIAPGGDVNADNILESLQRAFDDEGTKGVILRINSPGGSPVQSGIINDEIKRQKQLHPKIPVYAVVEDICASGGYFIAAAADKIYVNKASIVGSIGVLMDGYGFTGLMDKVGVERRLLTAGRNKAMLDPFSPVNPEHKAYAQEMLDEIHQQFIAVVRDGRGDRLKEDADTFSGLFWSGEKSVAMGLADGFGSTESVARDVIKQEELVDFTYQENPIDKFAKQLGASIGNTIGLNAINKGIQLK